MAAYDPTSLIKFGSTVDINAILAALKDSLPAMYNSTSADGPTASTSLNFATLDSFTLEFSADEMFLVAYRATLACNSVNAARSWGEIQITVDGDRIGKPSNVYTDYENNSKDGAQAVVFGVGYGYSGILTVAGQGRVTWDTGSGDTIYFGNRELICIKWKYRTA